MSDDIGFLAAGWPAPAAIGAGTTLRTGGVSQAPFDSFNLGDRAGDAPDAVAGNRARLQAALALPDEPAWLYQVHGTTVADAGARLPGSADASVATAADAVCAVLTADCLPVLLCDRRATCWGAAHAGWRGLASGVLEATIAGLPARPGDLLAWLGPAIGADAFEVGQDVFDAFVGRNGADAEAFTPRAAPGKYLADIDRLARARLRRAGVGSIHGGGWCTVSAPERFYSWRRDGRRTGRMASLIWRAGPV